MLPRVILHNAVSLDGRVTGFMPDLGLYYQLAGRWNEDATLVGSGTILAPMEEIPSEQPGDIEPPPTRPDDSRPLLVVADSRGRVRTWHYLRKQPYWRDWIALGCEATPQDHLEYLQKRQITSLTAGTERVDLKAALETLKANYSVKVVRVDSGGTLNGALLRAGLVDEVSLVVHPLLVGGPTPVSFFRVPDLPGLGGAIPCKLKQFEKLQGDILWLVYEMTR